MDVDGTLYRQGPVRRAMTSKLIRQLASNPFEGYRTLRAIRSYRMAQEHLRRTGEPASLQLSRTVEMTGYARSWVESKVQLWMEELPLAHVASASFAGVAEFCRWARKQGIMLGVVSDYDPTAKLRAMALDRYVTVAVCAQEDGVNCFKPHPKGLLKALQQIGVMPANAVYIGDRAEVDGEAARAAGMDAFILGGDPANLASGLHAAADWPSLHRTLALRFEVNS